MNLLLLTSTLLSDEVSFNVKTYGTNDISSHTAHTCVYKHCTSQRSFFSSKNGAVSVIKIQSCFLVQ